MRLVVMRLDLRQTRQPIFLELEQRRGGCGTFTRLAIITLVFVDRSLLFLNRHGLEIFRWRIRIDQAIDQFIDAHLVFGDLVRAFENFNNRRRTGGNRLNHVLEAIFDALGDFDFTLTRQQLDRTHLPHVHAHRIGGTAEFGVNGRQRLLRLLLDIGVVGNRRRRIFRHQQSFGIRRLVIDLNAHVAERADDALDLLGIDNVVRQVVVHLRVGQKTAILAQLDQRLEARLAHLLIVR